MDVAITITAVVAVVLAVTTVARKLTFLAPLLLLIAGAAVSYIPGVEVELTSEVVLVGLLPPLLYSAAIQTSLVDLYKDRGPIAQLSVALVIFTAFGVGLLTWWVLPIGFAAAFALGAVVAPPDAVAASAIARSVGMPRRVVGMLEGESLLNDATALVLLTTAITAIGSEVTGGDVALTALEAVVGGVVVGVLVALIVGKVRHRLTDDLTDVGLSLITPWLAYLPAEHLHGSGVLSVVIAGVVLGHSSPKIQSASSRVFERTNWATISFLLENAVFLLIGLQANSIITALGQSTLGGLQIAGAAVAVLVATIALRFVFMFGSGAISKIRHRHDARDPYRDTRVFAKIFTLMSWSGMRGVVTLAAAFLLPEDTPHREVLVLIAFVVTAGTLGIQGLTLPWLVRKLGLPGPTPAEDAREQATVFQLAAEAGEGRLDELGSGVAPGALIEEIRQRSQRRVTEMWQQLEGGEEPPTVQLARLRTEVLQAERAELLRLRNTGEYDQHALSWVLSALDLEETVLGTVTRRADRIG